MKLPPLKRSWVVGTGVIAGLSLIFEVLFHHHGHPYFWWHAVPLFDLALGVVGCILLVVVAKGIGYTFLQRDERYYGDETS